jgi:carbonic anhydrase
MERTWLIAPLFVLAACAAPAPAPKESADPLARLMEGNARFVAGKPAKYAPLPERRAEVAKAQHPFAIVLGCADSRAAPELVFDRTVGDLFVVRVAGNVVDDALIGSIEYSAEHLHVPLLVVLGHERCGAVTAAVEGGEAPGHIGAFVQAIAPAVAEARNKKPGDLVDESVRANVRLVVAQLRKQSHLLAELEHEGKLKIVGARYDLDTGEVTLVE